MTKDKKSQDGAREFWILFQEDPYTAQKQVYNSLSAAKSYGKLADIHHVIEMSAYLVLQKELEVLKINRNYHVENYQGVCRELDKTRAKLANAIKRIEELTQKMERLNLNWVYRTQIG